MIIDYREWLLHMVIMYGTQSPIEVIMGTNIRRAMQYGHVEYGRLTLHHYSEIRDELYEVMHPDYSALYVTDKAITYLEKHNETNAKV